MAKPWKYQSAAVVLPYAWDQSERVTYAEQVSACLAAFSWLIGSIRGHSNSNPGAQTTT